MKNKPDLAFVLSMDTEEEWDWSGPFPDADFSVSNAGKLPEFQSFCDAQGIRPTYFVDYAIADNPFSADILRELVISRNCEIGAHLHPWANPPYYGRTTEFESHVVNLPLDQAEAKLDALCERLFTNLGVSANAFRTGRWGVNGRILELLRRRGLRVDSSMYPCFSNDYFDCQKTPLAPYWPDFQRPMESGRQRDVMEFPVTVGFNVANQKRGRALYNMIANPSLAKLRLIGAFWQMRLLRKIYLSPEVMTGADMCALVDIAIKNELPVLHMFLHSSSLKDLSRGMMNREEAFETVTSNIGTFLDYARKHCNLQFFTISEAALTLANRGKISTQ